MTKLYFGAAIAALAATIPAAAPAQRLSPAVIAVVDIGRVSTECTACRAAATQLQTQGQQLQQRGATVILDKGSTLASGANIDVTNDVLAQLNQQLPSVSVTPLPQQQTQQQPTGR